MKSLDSRQSILRSAASAIGSSANATVQTILLDINTILGSGTAGQLFISNGSSIPFFSSTVAQSTIFGTGGTNLNDYALLIRGNSTTGESYGLLIEAGTNSSDLALNVKNQTNTTNLLSVRGDGLAITKNNVLDDNAGNMTINGQLGVGAAPIGTVKVRVSGTDSTITGPNAAAFAAQWVANSNNTSNIIGYIVEPTTPASTTVTHVTGYEADGCIVGSGGSVITLVDFLTSGAAAHSATNNAALADNQLFTGNLFIAQRGTDPSSFIDGNFEINSAGNLFLTQSTGAAFINFKNNGNPGFASIGVESSTGGNIFPATTPYAAVFGTSDANPVQIATHNIVALTVDISQNLTVVGLAGSGTRAVSADSTGKLVSGSTAFTAPTIQQFTSGSGTYTTPANVLYIRVRMVGGGGGGAGGGDETGSAGGAGGSGGDTTFGSSFLTAGGGGGGHDGNTSSTGGVGGTVLGGTGLSIKGSGGQGGSMAGAPGFSEGACGGNGGAGPWGGNGSGNCVAAPTAGAPGSGSGGGGGYSNGLDPSPGGGGGSGGYIEQIIGPVGVSYGYSVGGSGTAGTAGSNGVAGAAGGSGYIIVEEFYQ